MFGSPTEACRTTSDTLTRRRQEAVALALGADTPILRIVRTPQVIVKLAPTVVAPASQTSTVGVAVTGLAATVADADTPLTSLVLTATSSNKTLLPNANVTLGGTGASRTVAVAPAAGKTGVTTVTLTVRDPEGLAGTDIFTLTVS